MWHISELEEALRASLEPSAIQTSDLPVVVVESNHDVARDGADTPIADHLPINLGDRHDMHTRCRDEELVIEPDIGRERRFCDGMVAIAHNAYDQVPGDPWQHMRGGWRKK